MDHNPTSTTADSSFHGTAISVFQHPEKDSEGVKRNLTCVLGQKDLRLDPLPDEYTIVPAAIIQEKSLIVLETTVLVCPESMDTFKAAREKHTEWLEKIIKKL